MWSDPDPKYLTESVKDLVKKLLRIIYLLYLVFTMSLLLEQLKCIFILSQ